MAGPNRVNILISVRNRASKPINRVRKDLTRFRGEVVRFNRNLFTASAVIATFTAGFRKAFQLAGVGAQFEFIREQFTKTFGARYLTTLKEASRFTMDSMTAMQLAIKNHARGLKKYETEKIFTLSVGAAKILGTSTANAAKQMSAAFTNLSTKGLQTFMVALNTNNQFSNMNLLIQKLTKGLNAAGRMTENFRRIALAELSKALMKFVDTGENTLQVLMATKASFTDLKAVIGALLGRAIAPLAKQLAMLNFGIFAKLMHVLDGTTEKTRSLRVGIVGLTQSIAGLVSGVGAAIGGYSLLRLLSATLGFKLSTLYGIMLLLGGAFMSAKDKSKSWMETLADVGAELKFYMQAFMSYKDGVSTFSGEVAARIGGMSKDSQERILMIAKALVLTKEAIYGVFEGIKAMMGFIGTAATTIVGWVGTVLKFFKLIDDKQFSIKKGGMFRAAGAGIGGVLAAGLVGNLLLKPFGKSLMGKGGGGLFGRRGNSPLKPMYVLDVSMGGKGAGKIGLLARMLSGSRKGVAGIGNPAGMMGGAMLGNVMRTMGMGFMLQAVGTASITAIASTVALGLVAGGVIGIMIDALAKKLFGKSISDWIGYGRAKMTGSRVQLDADMTNDQKKSMMLGMAEGTASIGGRSVDSSEVSAEAKKTFQSLIQQGGSLSTRRMEDILEDMKVSNEEILKANEDMKKALEREKFDAINDKYNWGSKY